MRYAIWQEGKGYGRDNSAHAATRERERQQIHTRTRQDVGEDHRDVVDEDRISQHPLQGRREDRDAQKILRVGQGPRGGKKIRSVPESLESVANSIGVPSQNPGV